MAILEGRAAIVTGSTGEGMGRQTAWTLAREGCNVILNYGTYRKGDAAAQKAVKGCEALGGRAIAVRADTRKEADLARLVAKGESEFGRVDIAVANGGGDLIERPLEKLTQAEWHRVVDAEVDGLFFLAKAVLPGMRKQGWGRIVSIGWDRAPMASALPYDYAVGKAARDLLAQKLARAERDHGVTVNTVAPGAIPYPTDAQSKDFVRHGKQWFARKRAWNQDVAEQVLWLCREESRFVTGSRIEVYGPH
ncbi:MAG TPA: SDR family oxidoreductase [Candidatus Thermoplasmatota archaeon]|nr:SDR family oxidoreductase [Candidatus Thermoplasmatota archaeon]